MCAQTVTLTPLRDIPLVEPGADLAHILNGALVAADRKVASGDVLVIAQKIVSKAEGRYVDLAEVQPSRRARELASKTGKDPRLVETILGESQRVVRTRPGLVIVEHALGLIMANAGIDRSNIEQARTGERVLLLPEDPDRSAAQLQAALEKLGGVRFGVVISDSFGRPWRNGVTGIAIGSCGVPALLDLTGRRDLFDRPLEVTQQAVADELASAASLLMGQADEAIPAVLIQGLSWRHPEQPARALIRPADQDLFR